MAIAMFAHARSWLSSVLHAGSSGAFWPHPPAPPQYDASSLSILVERYLDARKAALDKTIHSQKHAIYVLFAIGLLSALAVIALMAGMGETQTATEADESATALGLFLVLSFGAFWYWKKRERVSHELEKEYFDLALTKFEAMQWRTEASGEALIKVKELRLREKLFPLYRRLSRLRFIYYTASTLAVLAVLAVPTVLIATVQFPKLELDKDLVLGIGVYAFAFAYGTMWARTRMKIVRDDVTQTEVAIDMLQFGGNDDERRAENLIRVNEIELRRYYDINSSQAGRIFWVGVSCIVAGFAIVCTTLWFLVVKGISDPAAVWPTAVVGTICALLPNFVGAIYMKLHGDVASALTTFHGRLVDSHRLFLANLIASRLENSQDRDATLKELALRMVGNDHAGGR
jgi:FtsH-binding integral membrane protein